jgi:hypothetical protein
MNGLFSKRAIRQLLIHEVRLTLFPRHFLALVGFETLLAALHMRRAVFVIEERSSSMLAYDISGRISPWRGIEMPRSIIQACLSHEWLLRAATAL